MAVSSATELKILVKTAGEQNLNRLSRQLEAVGKDTASADFKFDKFSRSLKRQEQQATRNISNLRTFAGAWRELANSVDYTSKEFREATREAQRLEKQLAKTQKAGRGGGLQRFARTGGAIAAAGIFGGPEGALGAGIGAVFGGPYGAAVGGAIGAQVGQFREQLGGTAEYAAEMAKQRLALQLVTKEAGEYQRALAFIDDTSRKFAIPQDIITRQFTKLTASVKGAGGTVADAETAFLGVAAGIRGTGGSLQDLDSALTATSQVFSKGKVSAEELRQQIGERLPGAFTLFAESLGMTPQELDKALEKGQVSLQDFQTFAEKLFKDYGKAAEVIASGPEAAGDRLQTALGRLSESVGDLLRPIGATFQSTFANIVNYIDQATRSLANFLGLGKGRAGEIAKYEKLIETHTKGFQTWYKRKDLPGAAGQEARERMAMFKERYYQDRAKLDALRAAERAAANIKVEPPKGLPGATPSVPSTTGRTQKPPQDISRTLGEAQKAALAEVNPIQKSVLDFEAKLLQIRESNLPVEKRSVALAKVLADFKKEQEAIGKRIAAGNVAAYLSDVQRKEQTEQRIKDLEIEAGIIDETKARQLQKDRLIAELQQGNNKLTEEQLQRIDKAYEGINKKTSESTQLFRQLGQSVISTLADAFDNLFDQTKTMRDMLNDLLRQTARLLVEFGLRAGIKSLFPNLFANGGIMTGNGPLPLKRYANGGIATSPQLAMFGEGSTPEAYVPLPDGRSIPVKMKGGAGMGNVVVNVDATGTAVQGNQPDANKLGEALGIAVRQELIRQKRPGGLLA